MGAGSITWLVLGALTLSVLAVVLDRINFPQRPFKPRQVDLSQGSVTRDRTGAHIVNDDAEIEES